MNSLGSLFTYSQFLIIIIQGIFFEYWHLVRLTSFALGTDDAVNATQPLTSAGPPCTRAAGSLKSVPIPDGGHDGRSGPGKCRKARAASNPAFYHLLS